jgi:hypothetical protein
MRKWLRRIRGALGIGLSWAAAWSVVGALIGIVFFGGGLDLALFFNVMLFAVSGFIGGTTFGGLLFLAEGRRTFDQMSLPRFALWGAIGGLLMAQFFLGMGGSSSFSLDLIDGVVALMGAGSAAGSLAIARKAGGADALAAGEAAPLIEAD